MQFYSDNKKLISLISYLLTVTILIASIFPVQIHLHHTDTHDQTRHEHVIDSHLLFDNHDTSHAEHPSYHAVDTAPEATTKTPHSISFDQVLITLLVITLAAAYRLAGYRTLVSNFTLSSYRCYLSPPLRAPPL